MFEDENEGPEVKVRPEKGWAMGECRTSPKFRREECLDPRGCSKGLPQKKKKKAPGTMVGREIKRRPGSKVETCEPRLRYYFGPRPLTLGRGIPGRHDTSGGLY